MSASRVGEKIFNERVTRKMTRADLSRISGINGSTIAAIENGQAKNPRADIVVALAGALDIENAELMSLLNRRSQSQVKANVPLLKINIGDRMPAQPFTEKDIASWEQCDIQPLDDLLAMTISGDSMMSFLGSISIPDEAVITSGRQSMPKTYNLCSCNLTTGRPV